MGAWIRHGVEEVESLVDGHRLEAAVRFHREADRQAGLDRQDLAFLDHDGAVDGALKVAILSQLSVMFLAVDYVKMISPPAAIS